MRTTTIMSPGNSFSVRIAASGVPLQVHNRTGDNYPFVAGVNGAQYVITVANLSERRLLIVVSVDGKSVLDNEECSWNTSRGMIIESGRSYPFRGWRLSDDQTAPFVFNSPEDSVSALTTGSTGNVGVIGFAGFVSKPPPPVVHQHVNLPTHDVYRGPWIPGDGPRRRGGMSLGNVGGRGQSVGMVTNTADSVPVASAAAIDDVDASYDLGTGIGDEVQHDPVSSGFFNRKGITPDILAVGYATWASLRAAGIVTEPELPADRDPFPGNDPGHHETGYRPYMPRLWIWSGPGTPAVGQFTVLRATKPSRAGRCPGITVSRLLMRMS